MGSTVYCCVVLHVLLQSLMLLSDLLFPAIWAVSARLQVTPLGAAHPRAGHRESSGMPCLGCAPAKIPEGFVNSAPGGKARRGDEPRAGSAPVSLPEASPSTECPPKFLHRRNVQGTAVPRTTQQRHCHVKDYSKCCQGSPEFCHKTGRTKGSLKPPLSLNLTPQL